VKKTEDRGGGGRDLGHPTILAWRSFGLGFHANIFRRSFCLMTLLTSVVSGQLSTVLIKLQAGDAYADDGDD